MTRAGRLQLGQTGHVLAMNAGGPRKIALKKLVANLPQMQAREPHLARCRWRFHHHLLNPAGVVFVKMWVAAARVKGMTLHGSLISGSVLLRGAVGHMARPKGRPSQISKPVSSPLG